MRTTIFIFFISLISIAQTSNEAIYKVIATPKKESKLEKMMLEMFPSYYTISEEFEFSLLFTKQESFFLEIPKLYSDESAVEVGQLKVLYSGATWIKNDTIYCERENEFSNKFIQKQKLNFDWKITNETKKIDGLNCVKATGIRNVKNSKGEFSHHITAWFCPQIPYPFGPLIYNGLPGLIIEVQEEGFTYGLSKLFMNVKNKKIPPIAVTNN